MPFYACVVLLAANGCDRKPEPSPEAPAPGALEATNSTIIAVTEPGLDAGADATVSIVGVSITTIVPRGHRDVVENIANARCRRKQRCNNVGVGQKYATFESCRTQIATDWRDELNKYECPGGLVQKELDECMRELENEDCSHPLDTLERIIACRSGDICLSHR